MIVADGWITQFNPDKQLVRLSLMRGDDEISTLILDDGEMEILIEKLRDTMRKAKEPPRRRKHPGGFEG